MPIFIGGVGKLRSSCHDDVNIGQLKWWSHLEDVGMSGTSVIAVGAAVAVSEEQKREVIAIDLHQSLHPLVEGTQKSGEVCSSVSGAFSETITRPNQGREETIAFDRNLFSSDSAAAKLLPGLTLETKIDEPLLSSDVVTSQIKDASGKLLETRISTIGDNFFSHDTIDTTILDAGGKLKGSIHSDLRGFWGDNDIDTVVKNAAGEKVRELHSTYDDRVTEPDRLCTHLR
jgi:hypothetical protein